MSVTEQIPVTENRPFLWETALDIATVDGSCTDTIIAIAEAVGKVVDVPVNIKVVRSVDEAEKMDFNRLMLLGGSDIDPAFYGEEKTNLCQPLHASRDKIEWTLGQRAKANNVPIMGICRGHQMLTALYGGALYQDFEKQTNTYHAGSHALANIGGPAATRFPKYHVNSLHHQAVKVVPDGFEVIATAKDGIIESIWKPGVIGVQFHPEMMVMEDSRWLNLFLWYLLDRAE